MCGWARPRPPAFRFRAFASGALTSVSPVASAYSACTVALDVLFLDERPSPRQLAGIGLVLVGVVLTAVHLDCCCRSGRSTRPAS